MTDCVGLYTCKGWNCNRCFPKKLFWLREQAVRFALSLAGQATYFTTLKSFNSAQDASQALKAYMVDMRANKARYNAKLEYFFSISKHGHSNWHVHIISNRYAPFFTAYHEPAKDRRAVCLYIVKNLAMSRSQNYGKVRRFGGSSLLNKTNLKKTFKTRVCLWNIRTRQMIVRSVFNAMSSRFKVSSAVECRPSNRRIPMRLKPSNVEYRAPVERPPPKRLG